MATDGLGKRYQRALKELEALRRVVNQLAKPWPTFPDPNRLHIEYYAHDPRTGRHTWLVTLSGHGVLGMID